MSSFVPVGENGLIMPLSADPGESFPFLHTITVVDRVISVDKPELVQNNIRTETVTLNLDSEWDGLSTVINIGSVKPVSVIWSGEPVVIPAELMTDIGSLDVSVVGYGDDGAVRAVTKQASNVFNVVASGFVEGDEPVPDPTTILGQLVAAADNANKAADRFNQASDDIEGIAPAIERVQTSETNAKTSETNAASSAENASQSASTALESAKAAKTSETNAAASAASASEASTAAKASETNAASSATTAAQSAAQAQSSVTSADSFAQAASKSAETAKMASDSATSSKNAAAQSASEVSTSAQAAKTSETNAASSAEAAKTSETNAAASATAAQNAVDGFGLEVGTTTTGDPGTDAIVNIVKQGTKYVADFTIPRGEKGDPSSGGGISSIVTDTTLTGDGTSAKKLGIANGLVPYTTKNINDGNLIESHGGGYFKIIGTFTNGPKGTSANYYRGMKIEIPSYNGDGYSGYVNLMAIPNTRSSIGSQLWVNYSGFSNISDGSDTNWYRILDSGMGNDIFPDGSISRKYSIIDSLDESSPTDILSFSSSGYYSLWGYYSNLPSDVSGYVYGNLIVLNPFHGNNDKNYEPVIRILSVNNKRSTLYIRISWRNFAGAWYPLDFGQTYVPLSTYQALETRVQALEAKLANQ